MSKAPLKESSDRDNDSNVSEMKDTAKDSVNDHGIKKSGITPSPYIQYTGELDSSKRVGNLGQVGGKKKKQNIIVLLGTGGLLSLRTFVRQIIWVE